MRQRPLKVSVTATEATVCAESNSNRVKEVYAEVEVGMFLGFNKKETAVFADRFAIAPVGSMADGRWQAATQTALVQ